MSNLSPEDITAIADAVAERQPDRLLRDVDVAAVLAIGKSTVRHYVSKKLIPAPLKFGCTAVWRESDIQRVIRNLEVAA